MLVVLEIQEGTITRIKLDNIGLLVVLEVLVFKKLKLFRMKVLRLRP